MTPVIIDVNVIFSALGGPSSSFPMRTMEMVVEASWQLMMSDELIGEIRDVLIRPRAQARHQLSEAELLDFLSDLRSVSNLVEPEPGPRCPDPADQHLWDLLATVEDSLLVTGERKLRESAQFLGRVLSPREFVELYASGPDGETVR